VPGAFGAYRVMHQLGVGVLGPVFRGYSPEGDCLVAVKAFQLEVIPEQAVQFADRLDAIVALGSLHPSQVRPLGSGVTDDVPFIAYEYVAAESLDVGIRRFAKAPVETVVPLVLQLSAALDAAHGHGLCHGALHFRDIFSAPDLARVTGFGIQAALQSVGLRGPLRRPFAAPEQIADKDWDAAADRFALAAVTYELLTGKRAGGDESQLSGQLSGVAVGRRLLDLVKVFAEALSEDPVERPESALLFAEQLSEAVDWDSAGRVLGPVGVSRVENDLKLDSFDASSVANGGAEVSFSSHDVKTVLEEDAMPKSDERNGKSQSGAKLDWTEHSLDRGLPEEVQGSDSYEPRPVGSPSGSEREADLEVSKDLDRLDLSRGSGDEGVGDEGYSSALDAIASRTEVESVAGSPKPSTVGSMSSSDLVGGSEETEDGSLSGKLGGSGTEPEFDWDVSEQAEAALEEIESEGRSKGNEHREVEEELSSADDTTTGPDQTAGDRLAAIQARYRSDDRPEAMAATEDEKAVAEYEPIKMQDLKDRLGEDGAESEDRYGEDEGLEDETSLEVSGAQDDGVSEETRFEYGSPSESDVEDNPNDEQFPLLTDEAYGYRPGGDDQEVSLEDFVEPPDSIRNRRWVPIAATSCAVAVVLGLLGLGSRWMTEGAGSEAVESPALARSLPVEEEAVAVGSNPAPREVPPPRGDVPGLPLVDRLDPQTDRLAASQSSVYGPENVEADSPLESGHEDETPSFASSLDPALVVPVGRLLVRSTPPGAQVMLDGESRGTTPLAVAELPYGDYTLSVSLEGFESREQLLTVSSDDPIVALNVELGQSIMSMAASNGVGSISVETRPAGAEVWLDRRFVGETPMLIPDVTPGAHVVEFRQMGYRDWATNVSVDPSEQARVAASLDHARP